jgi:signal transduction histidine kinase
VCVRIVEDGNWVQLDVTDTGIGIPADEQDLLFEPFARGSNTGENIAGSGLGLYIANRIVQHHGGTIAIKSVLGAGTTVTARLPRSPMDSLLAEQPWHGDGESGPIVG